MKQHNNNSNASGAISNQIVWSDYIKRNIVKSSFPGMNNGNHLKKDYESKNFKFEEEASNFVQKISNESDHRLFVILTSAVFILLHKYTLSTEIFIGTSTFEQNKEDEDKIIPLRMNYDENISFKENIFITRELIVNALDDEKRSLTDLMIELESENHDKNSSIFDVTVQLKNVQSEKSLNTDLIKQEMAIVFSRPENGPIACKITYNKNRYLEKQINFIFLGLNQVFKYAEKDVDLPLCEIDVVSEEEKEELLSNNRETLEYNKKNTVLDIFYEMVDAYANKIAITDTSTNEHITYKELNSIANNYAEELIQGGVQNNSIVGIKMERSVKLIAYLIATMKAGACYLPLDLTYPEERIDYMIKDSCTRFIVGSKGIEGQTRTQNNKKQQTGLSTQSSFYISYTSGSTGKPKGVVINHEGFVNLIYSHKKIFGEKQGTHMSQVANVSFGAFAFEVWPSLLSGGTLFLAGMANLLSVESMKQWLLRYCIEISFQPTVIAEKLFDLKWDERYVALNHLRTAGERLSRYPAGKFPFFIYNLYGPTENSVWSTYCKLNTDEKGYPPIGKGIPNFNLYITDNNLKLQPIGVIGELCIGGVGVSAGYLNKPELTQEKFVNDPYNTNSKMYKSGDMVKWLSDGNIDYIGRLDHQVKVRGFRIELEEIEKNIAKYDKVDKAVSMILEDEKQGKVIYAYVQAKSKVTLTEMREYLKKFIPNYMMPSYFVFLDKFPLTSNGKIDKNELKKLKPTTDIDNDFLIPSTNNEIKLSDIWKEILSYQKISLNDNFFDLGGTSMDIVKLSERIKETFETEISIIELFNHPNINEQLKLLND